MSFEVGTALAAPRLASSAVARSLDYWFFFLGWLEWRRARNALRMGEKLRLRTLALLRSAERRHRPPTWNKHVLWSERLALGVEACRPN